MWVLRRTWTAHVPWDPHGRAQGVNAAEASWSTPGEPEPRLVLLLVGGGQGAFQVSVCLQSSRCPGAFPGGVAIPGTQLLG